MIKELIKDILYIIVAVVAVSLIGTYLLLQRISLGEMVFVCIPGFLLVPFVDLFCIKMQIPRFKRLIIALVFWVIAESAVILFLGQSLSTTGY